MYAHQIPNTQKVFTKIDSPKITKYFLELSQLSSRLSVFGIRLISHKDENSSLPDVIKPSSGVISPSRL